MSTLPNEPLEFSPSLAVTCPRATEDLVIAELQPWLGTLPSVTLVPGTGAVRGQGNAAELLRLAYVACLHSRVASRVLWPIGRFTVHSYDDLYAAARQVAWDEHFSADQTFALDVSGEQPGMTHSLFTVQRVKDAIVDQFRDKGTRPNVGRDNPDVLFHIYIHAGVAEFSVDLSGEALHRRHYRQEQGAAPLKENLAAAIVLRSRWPEVSAAGGVFVDPMCGSGSLVLEAALIAVGRAPGLLRQTWGFSHWQQHQADVWHDVLTAAQAAEPLPTASKLYGFDASARMIQAAKDAAARLSLSNVEFQQAALSSLSAPESAAPGPHKGIVVCNPPYGERLGTTEELTSVYEELGKTLKQRFVGYSGHIITADPDLAAAIGLRANRKNILYNGALRCELRHFDVYLPKTGTDANAPKEASAIANRLRKNLKHLGGEANRLGVTCYRLYDADMPEYAVAVDIYEGCAHVQEYAPPKTIAPGDAQRRLREAVAAVREVLELPANRVFVKTRQRHKRTQYERHETQAYWHGVHENGLFFVTNLSQYIDTGIFLDHRRIRELVGELSAGKHVLNLFCYTGTVSVYAARAGAKSTTSVDISNTYLDWAEDNFRRNGLLAPGHRFIRDDCLQWLANEQGTYDVIFLNPPTFSTSKRMDGTLDIQRDHADLLHVCYERLRPGGVLLFTTHARRFRLDEGVAPLNPVDITESTRPFDFAKGAPPYKAWRFDRPQ